MIDEGHSLIVPKNMVIIGKAPGTPAPVGLPHPLDDCCFPLSNTHAKRDQAIIGWFLFLCAPFHFMQQRGQEASSRTSQWMTESNGPPVDIDPLGIQAQVLDHSQGLDGKGFVQFDQMYIG